MLMLCISRPNPDMLSIEKVTAHLNGIKMLHHGWTRWE
jgi:hypothetical protein